MELIRRNQRSAEVADIQARLARMDFEIAESERGGLFGPTTEAAVKALQQSRGLHVDGLVGEATWRELVESSWTLGDRPLNLSNPNLRGDDVRDLQTSLNALGFKSGKHDGIFGLRTEAALKEFQQNLAIGEDGICGLETIGALRRLRLVIKPGLGPRVIEREARKAHPPGLSGKRIAIDPGHGGEDPGETAANGESEAELTFRIAARTSVLLESSGAVAILTRGPNDGPSDSERAALANEFAAQLLVSIHLNAHPKQVAGGAATYFFQHGSIASESGEHLAGLMQCAFVDLGRLDCRSHGKAYPILRETVMPAVVVEPGFITNPAELSFLTETSAVERLAEAMVLALENYFESDSPAEATGA
ncbi:MAG: N-acetylmuramoyl-L-alanine amidase [Actinomycetota bacterium]